MSYQIKIVRKTINPDFQQQLAAYEEKNRGRMNRYDDGRFVDENTPKEELVKNVLLCELTDEEYKKVKEEIVKVFE